MTRSDIIKARDLAAEFVAASDAVLAATDHRWNQETGEYDVIEWRETWQIAGKLTGAHRRLSLDLTRALAYMRRRR